MGDEFRSDRQMCVAFRLRYVALDLRPYYLEDLVGLNFTETDTLQLTVSGGCRVYYADFSTLFQMVTKSMT